MLEELKKEVYNANICLPKNNLVLLTWGNVSAIDENTNYIVIKPSGLEYEKMTPNDMVVLDLDGKIIEGNLNPSTDTLTHIEIYKTFREIKSIVHTHSRWATIWSQIGKSIKPYGTTHADYFYGEIPCTRALTDDEIQGEYEKNTGKVITETIKNNSINDVFSVPAILVKNHGPFTWGVNCTNAVNNAIILEEVAAMAWHTEISKRQFNIEQISQTILDRHYYRKHGQNSYYGQK